MAPPDAAEIVFDPHVATAIVCLALALVAALLAIALGAGETKQ